MTNRTDTYTLNVAVVGGPGLTQLQSRLRQVNQAMRETSTAGKQFNRGIADVGKSGRAASLGIQNVAFQVQDFAVQVASGTAASRALGQQLPQLLGGFGALGAVIGAAAAIFIPLLAGLDAVQEKVKLAAENADILIGAIGGLTLAFGGKFLVGLIAAKGGFIALTASTLAWADSLITVRGLLISTGLGAIAVAVGLAVTAFLRLREATGSWAKAATVSIQAIKDAFDILLKLFGYIAKNGEVVWELFRRYALNALADIIDKFDLFTITFQGKEIFSLADKLFDTSSLRTNSQLLNSTLNSLLDGAKAEVGDLSDAIKTVADAWDNYRFKLDFAGKKTEDDAKKTSKAISDAQRFIENLRESTIKLTDQTAQYRLEYDLLKQGLSSGEIERAVELQQLLAEATRLGVENTKEFRDALAEYSAKLNETADAAARLKAEQERIAEFKKVFTDIGDSIQNNLFGVIDSLIDGTKSLKQAFKEFAKSTIAEIGKIIVKMLVMKAIQTALGPLGGGGGIVSGLAGALGGLFRGGADSSSGFATPAALGTTPSGVPRIARFNTAPDALLSGAANQNSRGGGDVNIYNQTSASVTASKKADGGTDIVITEKVLANSIQRGGNTLATTMEKTYGLVRQGR